MTAIPSTNNSSTVHSMWFYVTDLRLFYWSKRTSAKRQSEVRQLTYNPYLGVETATILLGMLALFLTLLALCKIRRCLRHRWRRYRFQLSEQKLIDKNLKSVSVEDGELPSAISSDKIQTNSNYSERRIFKRIDVDFSRQPSAALLIPVRRLSRSSDAIFLPREPSSGRILRDGFVSPNCGRVIRFQDQLDNRRAVTEPPDGLRIFARPGNNRMSSRAVSTVTIDETSPSQVTPVRSSSVGSLPDP